MASITSSSVSQTHRPRKVASKPDSRWLYVGSAGPRYTNSKVEPSAGASPCQPSETNAQVMDLRDRTRPAFGLRSEFSYYGGSSKTRLPWLQRLKARLNTWETRIFPAESTLSLMRSEIS